MQPHILILKPASCQNTIYLYFKQISNSVYTIQFTLLIPNGQI